MQWTIKLSRESLGCMVNSSGTMKMKLNISRFTCEHFAPCILLGFKPSSANYYFTWFCFILRNNWYAIYSLTFLNCRRTTCKWFSQGRKGGGLP